jgi:hypothetical protein
MPFSINRIAAVPQALRLDQRAARLQLSDKPSDLIGVGHASDDRIWVVGGRDNLVACGDVEERRVPEHHPISGGPTLVQERGDRVCCGQIRAPLAEEEGGRGDRESDGGHE